MKKVVISAFLIICVACSSKQDRSASIVNSTGAEIQMEKSSASVEMREPKVDDQAFIKTREVPDKVAKDEVVSASTPKSEAKPTSVQPKISKDSDTSTSKGSDKQKKSKPKLKKYPVITFDSIVHQLPDITEGDVFKHTFNFENTGNAPLSITAVNATCGCTVPSFPFIDLAPGEKGYIGVEYHSVNKHGPQRPELTVIANIKEKKMILAMEFEVLEKEDEKQLVKKDTSKSK